MLFVQSCVAFYTAQQAHHQWFLHVTEGLGSMQQAPALASAQGHLQSVEEGNRLPVYHHNGFCRQSMVVPCSHGQVHGALHTARLHLFAACMVAA